MYKMLVQHVPKQLRSLSCLPWNLFWSSHYTVSCLYELFQHFIFCIIMTLPKYYHFSISYWSPYGNSIISAFHIEVPMEILLRYFSISYWSPYGNSITFVFQLFTIISAFHIEVPMEILLFQHLNIKIPTEFL
jgi:hypothetical protein